MFRTHRWSVKREQTAALEDAVDNGEGEVFVVQHAPPGIERFVRREDHRALVPMAIVDDVKEHVGSVRAVGKIPDFVDDQDGRMRVRRQPLRESAAAKGIRQIVDQFRRGDKPRIKAVLNGAIGNGDCQMGFAPARFARQDQRPTLGDKVGRQGGAEQRQSDDALIGEIEVVDRLEKRKVGPARQTPEARLLAMGDLFGQEQREKIATGPVLAFGAAHEVSPHPSRIGQMQPFETAIQIEVGDLHERPPSADACGAWADDRSSESCGSLSIEPPGCPRRDDRSSARPVLSPEIGVGAVTTAAK